MLINTKYGEIKIFAESVEQVAMSQIIRMSNSLLGENANLRIMPDVHAGAGCVIGTTMRITDKVCPNLVGVDIGCGVDLVKTDIDFGNNLDKLDEVIRSYIPYGMNCHRELQPYDFTELRCWNKLHRDVRDLSQYSLGTLGGGNHFIEAYNGGHLSVHSGSRNIGWRVADYYQKQAENYITTQHRNIIKEELQQIEPQKRENWLKSNKIVIDKELSFLQESLMDDYLHDIKIMQDFAVDNRQKMLFDIVNHMGGKILEKITSTHNYIDTNNMILRKGSISAQKDEILIIPLNMRDGVLICKGKGNPDWNYSAPHGAGRLYSRSKAKELFSVEEYEKSMEGIYSTCISDATLDEAPFAYKDFEEIERAIEPTVEILNRLKPIFNFKAN